VGAEHGDDAADVTGIAGEFDNRRGTGLYQRGIAVALIEGRASVVI